MQSKPLLRNVLAGLFVVVSLIVGVLVAGMLSRSRGQKGGLAFTVRFTLADGAAGLGPDSPVTLAGMVVGKVRSVQLHNAPAPGARPSGGAVTPFPQAIDVTVDVAKDLVLYENTQVYLEKPLLGSLSALNIASPGTPEEPEGSDPSAGTWRVEGGDIVRGGVAPPAFLAQAGLGPEQVSSVKNTLASIERSVLAVESMVGKSGPDIASATTDARALVASVREQLPAWQSQISSVLTRAEAASQKLEPILLGAEGGVQEARVLVDDVRAIVRENRTRIDSILSSTDKLAQTLSSESLALLNNSLREGERAMQGVAVAVDDVRLLVNEQTPSLRRTLANLRLMSDQLKLTAVEVRSQPWRLLIQPTTKEFESQVLYDATRSYAAAASDVRAAAEVVQQLTLPGQRGGQAEAPAGGLDEAALEAASARLRESLETFAAAERALLQELVEQK
jgi:ABC-type transporter Mla subunit MlaD